MIFDETVYSTLIVSSSQKFNDGIKRILSDGCCYPLLFVDNISAAKRRTLENNYDFLIINSPLPDDTGIRFAAEITEKRNTCCLLLLKSDYYDEVSAKATLHGVYTLQKPTSAVMIEQCLKWMSATRERLKNLEKKSSSLEEKMSEIRLVNRAKWSLIENLKMTENDAHRYIEKQAMDRCLPRLKIAEEILNTYRKE